MIDVDHFKLVNDKYGHQAGDHVLITLAGIVEKQLRTEDLFARYGGEEWCCAVARRSVRPRSSASGYACRSSRRRSRTRTRRFR